MAYGLNNAGAFIANDYTMGGAGMLFRPGNSDPLMLEAPAGLGTTNAIDLNNSGTVLAHSAGYDGSNGGRSYYPSCTGTATARCCRSKAVR